MASQKEQHLELLKSSDIHKSGGCICAHGSKPKSSACDYQKNGYDITQGRKSWYNDKKITPDERRGIADAYKQLIMGGKAPSVFFHYVRSFKGARKRLEKDPKAWNVGYACYPERGENFLPKPHGGPGFWCPYIHNWHHLIPQSSPYQYIVGSDGSERGAWRLFLLMLAPYNINCKENIILLPNERFVSRIIGLPAHCPYDDFDHPQYRAAMASRMTAIRNTLDSAISADQCSIDISKCQAAAKAMNALSSQLITILRSMYPGQVIDDINPAALGG